VALNNTRLIELPTAFLHLKVPLFVVRFAHGNFKRGVKNKGKNSNVKPFLGVLAKLWKAVMSFLMYVRLSISLH
jgi:hypothetical protein